MNEKFLIHLLAFSFFPAIYWLSLILGYKLELIPYQTIESLLSQQMRDRLISTTPFLNITVLTVWLILSSIVIWKYKHLKSVKLSLLFGASVVVFSLSKLLF
jgi:hypothetical protein